LGEYESMTSRPAQFSEEEGGETGELEWDVTKRRVSEFGGKQKNVSLSK